MTGLKSIFITLLITSAFQLIGQVVTPSDVRSSYWIAPENYYAVNIQIPSVSKESASVLATDEPIPLVSRECIDATAIYRVEGEAGSTYEWVLTDVTGAIVPWTTLSGATFTLTTASITTDGTATTVTTYGSETSVLWSVLGNFNLEVIQTSVHTCKTIKLGEVQVYPQPEVYVDPTGTTCPQIPFVIGSAGVVHHSSVTWTTLGDGKFDEINKVNATYTPGANDINNGSVVLTIVANGLGDTPGCQTVTATTTLIIQNLEAEVVTSNITCFGLTDGMIMLEKMRNGTAPYKLYIEGKGWFNTDRYSGLGPGKYNVKIGDANGCERDLGIYTILEPELLTATVDPDPPTCKGNDGKITLSNPGNATSELVGIPGNYMYSIENVNGTFSRSSDKAYGPNESYTFGGLATGTYTVKIWDADHSYCVQTLTPTITLSDPDPLIVDAIPANVTCFGANDGTVSVTTHSGGSGNYEYMLSGTKTGGVSYNSGWVEAKDLISTIPSGVYTLQMRDASNTECLSNVAGPFTITEPPILAGTAEKTDEKCWNAKDGTIVVTASSGGYGKYQYMLDGILLEDGSSVSTTWTIDKTFANLAPGTYTLTIRDAEHILCTEFVDSYTILPAQKLTATVDQKNILCFGAGDGEITITDPLYGKADYTYSIEKDGIIRWDPTGLFTGLNTGTYTLQIKDANGCTNELDPVTITEPPKLIADYTHSTETIGGKDVGTVTVTSQEGGTPYSGANPYKYSKDEGLTWQFNPVFGNLDPGTYTITISDANDCKFEMWPVTIHSVGLILAKVTPNDVTCYDRNDGSITFYDLAGATSGKYEVSINNGLNWSQVTGTTYTFNNLRKGTYDLIVREDGLESTESDLGRRPINQPPPILAIVKMVQAETGTTKNGIVEVTSYSGGYPGNSTFAFRINGLAWQSNPQFTGLSKGDYIVDIRDVSSPLADCFISRTVKVVGEGELTASAVVTPARCDTDKATITITAAGVNDIEYSIDGVNFYLKQPIFSVGNGDYTLAIRDANNHTNSIVIPGTEPSGKWKVTIPAKLILTSTGYEWPTCQTPYAKFTITGATRNGVPVSVTGDLGEHRLPIGEFKTYYVYDQNGCPAEQSFGAPAPPSITSSAVPTDALCYGGTGTITFTPARDGTGPYTYSVKSNTYSPAPTLNKLVWANLPSGLTYTCTVTDRNGCKYETSVALGPMNPLTAPYAVASGTLCDVGNVDVVFTLNGGTPPYRFEGVNVVGNTITKRVNLSLGTQTFTLTDANGCTGSTTVSPVAPPDLQVRALIPACTATSASLQIDKPVLDPLRYQYSIDNGKTWTSTTLFTGLSFKTKYSVEVLDKLSQCSTATSATTEGISLPEMPVFEPVGIPTCMNPNGTITVKTPVNSGSRIYSYSKDGITYQASPVFPNLVGTTTYTIIVRDDISGCISSPVSIYVPAVPPPPVIAVSSISPKCYGETYTITISAPPIVSAGKTYDFDGVYTFFYDGGKFDNVKIQAGVATITGTLPETTNLNNIRFEANGCPSTGSNTSVLIEVPTPITITAEQVTAQPLKGIQKGEINLTVTGGEPVLSYLWTSDTFTGTVTTSVPRLTNLLSGNYSVIIIDKNNCSLPKNYKVPSNLPPLAVPDNYKYNCSPLHENIIANDRDPDDDVLAINTVPTVSPKHAKSFKINIDGTFDYEVMPGYTGPFDTFVYEIADIFGQTATATVTIAIAADFDGDGIADLPDDADADADGILNVDEVAKGGNWKTADSDGDGHYNWLDIDSDNDGIVDNIEAQSTSGYIAPSGIDKDNNGIDDAYDSAQGGTTIVPVDTDSSLADPDGIPDFLDTDSDNDWVADYIEGYDGIEAPGRNDDDADGKPNLIISGKDTDADGLDDSYDNVINGCNNGNSTGSYATATNVQDFDGDGLKDWRDDNDDDDEYLTRFEDMNADGDYSNDVTGHVGHPEYLWYGRDCELFIPDAFSPNDDNVHDYFQIYCIESYPNAQMYIFDQVGNKLYEMDHYGNLNVHGTPDQAWWDGTTNNRSATRNGNKVVPGTYYYVLRLGNGEVKKSFVFVSY